MQDALLYRVDHSDLDIELQEAGPPENLTLLNKSPPGADKKS